MGKETLSEAPANPAHAGKKESAANWLDLQADSTALKQIPCLENKQISEDWSPKSKAEQTCLLSIARESLERTLEKAKSVENPIDSLLKTFKNPGSISEAIGSGLIFELSENSIYNAFHPPKDDKDKQDLTSRLQYGIKQSLQQIKFLLELDSAIESPDLKRLFKETKNNLFLEKIQEKLKDQDNLALAPVLSFLDNKYEFLMGAPNRDYAGLADRPGLKSYFGNGKGLSYERLLHNRKTFEEDKNMLESSKRLLLLIAREESSIFKNEEEALNDVVPEAINQNDRSSVCVPMSVLASLAATERRSEIRSWIQRHEDGSVTVSLPGAAKAQTIPTLSLPHRIMFNSSKDHGYWSSVLLQAFAQNLPCKENTCTSLETEIPEYKLSISGGMSRLDDAIERITGRQAKQLAMYEILDRKILTATLKQAFDRQQVVIAAITNADTSPGRGLAPGHAYSVLRLDGSTVVLRDPMGVNAPLRNSPYVRIPISEFSRKFDTIAIETDKPLEKPKS